LIPIIQRRAGSSLELASSLTSWPSSVKELNLVYDYCPPHDHSFLPPNLLIGDSDLFSIHLRTFSQQLTSIDLRGGVVISSELFWPIDSDSIPRQRPHWPYVTSFTLNYAPVTPSGQWLFERDTDEEPLEVESPEDLSLYMEEDEIPPRENWKLNPFRRKANERLINDFYLAAGRAVAEMPCLRAMVLMAEQSTIDHSLDYEATTSTASLRFWSTPLFEPEESVLKVWKEAARKNTGAELEIKCLSEGLYLRPRPAIT
jgi:hypothetical protein